MKTEQQIDDYLAGARDCAEGVPHKAGKSAEYNRGYSNQYAWEQTLTEVSRQSRISIRGPKNGTPNAKTAP